MNRKEIQEYVLNQKEPFTVDQLSEITGIGITSIQRTVNSLIKDGYTFNRVDNYYIRSKVKIGGVIFDASRFLDKRYLRFGVVSDTHLSSIHERTDELHSVYDIFQKEGVKVVIHAGDVTDGWGVYRGQEFEIKHIGQQAQIDHAISVYPIREGMQTFFITGNHDLRQYERGGIDIGKTLASQRSDMTYLGQIYARVKIQETSMDILHPDGRTAYALSYKAQRLINNLQPKMVPDMMVWGHYHTSFYMHYRGIEFLQAPCFKDAGLWEKRLGMNPTIGAWMVDAVLSDDTQFINSFQPHLFHFE